MSLGVLFGMLLNKGGVKEVTGLVNYFLVQALRGFFLLIAVLVEVGGVGNVLFFSSPTMFLSLFLGFLGLLIKLGVFPYYLQIVYIFGFLERSQCFILSTYPKVVPMLLMGLLLSYLPLRLVMSVGSLSVLLGRYQRIWTSSVKELFGWSTIRHSGWIVFSLLGRPLFFFFYMGVYRLVISVLWNKYISIQNNYFVRGGAMIMLSKNNVNYLLLIFFILGRFAPFLGFLLKLMVVNWLTVSYGVAGVVVVLVLGLRAVFFYTRMVQFLSSVNRNYYRRRVFVRKLSGFGVVEVVLLGILLRFRGFLFI